MLSSIAAPVSLPSPSPTHNSVAAADAEPPVQKHRTTVLQTPSTQMPPPAHIWIITGPAGSGKSTVARYLASELDLPYIEGDDANIDKMSHGHPLTDADRWGWLEILRDQALHSLGNGGAGAVVTCSALKRSYRDVIRDIPASESNVRIHFVYLQVDEKVLLERVRARQNHYMKDDMVRSQISSLEEPESDELDCIRIAVEGTADQVSSAALKAVTREVARSRG